MSLTDELSQDVDSILRQEWNVREGQVVPKTEDVALAGGAVKLHVAMLYADLADSTDLAMNYDKRITAKVFKSFLSCSTKLIRKNGGEVRSFDGDRVMGVFIGDYKNTWAAKCALKINYAFLKIIKPKLLAKYPSLATGSYKLAHCVGVDRSDVLVIRGGVRNNNDLVWIGRAPNVAAKLSAIRNSPYHSYITEDVYTIMTDAAKKSSDGKEMWEKRENSNIVKGVSTLYRSSWTMTP
jgi:class 3 adenylate cyclase